MYHIFITLLSVGGHLGQFYFLAFMRRGAINMGKLLPSKRNYQQSQQPDYRMGESVYQLSFRQVVNI